VERIKSFYQQALEVMTAIKMTAGTK